MKSLVQRAIALVAEDEALLRIDVVDLLEDAGFTVLEAANTKQALRHLEGDDPIELLFTDIEMPGGMNGIELANHVADRWPKVAIVVCSGRIRPAAGELPVKASFIPKPLSEDIISKTIKKVMQLN